jgi:hypothetical protein
VSCPAVIDGSFALKSDLQIGAACSAGAFWNLMILNRLFDSNEVIGGFPRAREVGIETSLPRNNGAQALAAELRFCHGLFDRPF